MGVFFLAAKPPYILEIEDFVNTANLVHKVAQELIFDSLFSFYVRVHKSWRSQLD